MGQFEVGVSAVMGKAIGHPISPEPVVKLHKFIARKSDIIANFEDVEK